MLESPFNKVAGLSGQKIQKTKIFSGGRERGHWSKMG